MKKNYPRAFAVDGIKQKIAALVLAAGVMLAQAAQTAGPAPADPVSAAGFAGPVAAPCMTGSNAAQESGIIDGVDNAFFSGPAMELIIKANGSDRDIVIDGGDNLSISVQLNLGEHPRAYVDWWVFVRANSSWYCLNSSMQWVPFDINLSNCQPVYRGFLFNLPETQALNIAGLPAGEYRFWFAVGQMDWVWIDSVNVAVQQAGLIRNHDVPCGSISPGFRQTGENIPDNRSGEVK
ncbi:MAG: hypothetical protein WC299_07705 [Kiritimatiellia bacterium]